MTAKAKRTHPVRPEPEPQEPREPGLPELSDIPELPGILQPDIPLLRVMYIETPPPPGTTETPTHAAVIVLGRHGSRALVVTLNVRANGVPGLTWVDLSLLRGA